MSDQPNAREIDDFLDEFVGYLSGSGTEPDLAVLPLALRADAAAQAAVLRSAWGAGSHYTPPETLADDPVARRFGFDVDDPVVTVSVKELGRAIKRHGGYAKVASALELAGQDPGPILELPYAAGATYELPRPLVSVLVAILDLPFSTFTVREASAIARVLDMRRVVDAMTGWAERTGRSTEEARQRLRGQMPALAFRADEVVDDERLADIAIHLLESDT